MNRKKLLVLGLIGTFLSLICDLLLGWLVYPDAKNPMYAMLMGCDDLSYMRMGLSVIFGAIGIPMQYFGFKAIAEIVSEKSPKCGKLVNAGAVSTAAMGGTVHVLCVMLMLCFKLEFNGGFAPETLMAGFPESVIQFTLWGILPVSLIMMTPYYAGAVAMFITIVKGKTFLPKWACVFNPLIANVLTNIPSIIAPNTAFANGISMAGMAFGGMIPFAAILVFVCREKGK